MKFKRDNNLNYNPNQIVCSTGAKQSIAQLLMVILDKNDEVILPAPYWVSYKQMVKLADGVPKTIQTDINTNFKITPEKLEKAILSETGVCFGFWNKLNSPTTKRTITPHIIKFFKFIYKLR